MRSSTFRWQNTSATECPPHGCFKIVGWSDDGDGNTYALGEVSSSYGAQYAHAINSIVPVAEDEFGTGCQWCPAMVAAFDIDSDTIPSIGDHVGPRSGGWLLRDQTGGFEVVSIIDEDEGIIRVTHAPMITLTCQTDSAINLNASGTVSILWGTLGSEADTGVNLTAYNGYANLGSSKRCDVEWVRGDSWKMIAGRCS